MKLRIRSLAAVTMVLGFLQGCTPLNIEDNVSIYKRDTSGSDTGRGLASRKPDSGAGAASATEVANRSNWSKTPPLSPGDRLQIDIQDGEGFSGRYEVDIDGTLTLPHLSPLRVAGRQLSEVEKSIGHALVKGGYFKPGRVRVSARVHEWSHAQVFVSGAVFNPGMVSINVRNSEERALKNNLSSGDHSSERMLNAALRSAGGVRPDAAIDRIQVIRENRTINVDLRRVMTGHSVPMLPLMNGDRIVVPANDTLDPGLIKVSSITPPGIRVFLSNLTVPAAGNAESAIGKEASSLPYGARLLTAAVSANCVGGTNLTNASRHVVLVRNDPFTGREQVFQRPINKLLRNAHENEINPHMMPNDSVACYDSGVTNIRDIARATLELLAPYKLL